MFRFLQSPDFQVRNVGLCTYLFVTSLQPRKYQLYDLVCNLSLRQPNNNVVKGKIQIVVTVYVCLSTHFFFGFDFF